jgi:putative transcriptional regulator
MEVDEMLEVKIKVRLAELNLKHQDVANTLGVTKQTFSSWVNGKNQPTLEMAFKISELLECKVDELFTYKKEQ